MISGESIKDTILKNAKKRKIEDRIDIDGRTFQLKSFDPLIGNYILVTLLSVVMLLNPQLVLVAKIFQLRFLIPLI